MISYSRAMEFEHWFSASGLTVHQVAGRLGVHRQTVDRYVRGEIMPRPEMVTTIGVLTAGAVTADDLAASYSRRHPASQCGNKITS